MDPASAEVGNGLTALVPGLSQLWAETQGNPGVSIAVLDGPVDFAHPCLSGADLTTIATLVPSVATDGQATSHGTAVVSILFGRHGSGVDGIAPKCRGVIAPVFGENANGGIEASSQTDLGRAIAQAVEARAQIVNISGGELVESPSMDWPLGNAMKLCASEGVLVVAAAGNDSCACIHLPAAAPSALVVGALNANGEPSSFSNFGASYRAHGIVAPGENIRTAVSGGSTGLRSGSSYATPIVSGVAALLLARELLRGRKLRAREVYEVLLESAITCEMQPAPDCSRLFRGRLNVPGAIHLLDARANKTMVDAGTAIQTGRTNPAEGVVSETALSPSLPRQAPGLPPLSAAAAARGVAPAGEFEPAKGEAPAGALEPTGDEALTVHEPVPAEVAESSESAEGLPSGDASTTQLFAMVPSGGDGSHEVAPSGCGGRCAAGASPLVFVLGTLGFDFGTEAMRDTFHQANGGCPLYDNLDLHNYLVAHPSDAEHVIWTLSVDGYPVYAIRPSGPFGDAAYARLSMFLSDPEIERISIPGIRTAATETLFGGQVLPVIEPDLSGMSSWSTVALVNALIEQFPPPPGATNPILLQNALSNLLDCVYHGMRNAGISSQERALNFSVTNAYAVYQILLEASSAGMQFASVETEKSPLCRPESDCWDIKFTFFDPFHRDSSARQVYRYTVDVSDVEPVQIGGTRNWQVH